MYKISDVAKKLNVEKVLIFELLLTKGEYLEGNVVKKYGVTYLNDQAIEIIGKIISGEKIEIPSKSKKIENNENDSQAKLDENSKLDKVDDEIENIKSQDIKSSAFINQEDIDEKSDLISESSESKEIKAFNYKDNERENQESLGDGLKELQVLTAKSKFSKFEKEEKRNKISRLRNEFIFLDSEIRKKQDALESYDKILEEDIQWICILEDKLSSKLKKNISDDMDIYPKSIVEKIFFKK